MSDDDEVEDINKDISTGSQIFKMTSSRPENPQDDYRDGARCSLCPLVSRFARPPNDTFYSTTGAGATIAAAVDVQDSPRFRV